MKKVFAAMTAAIAVVTFMIVQAEEAFLTSSDDGYAVPSSSAVYQSLSAGADERISLTKVSYDDIIYQNISGYYIGEDREAIDVTYPMYVNGGAVLRFFTEDNWLVTPEITLQQTYDGLYLADGDSYNKGMQQTDDNEEFILLALANGLYMNAQSAVFTTRMETHEIPANSILYFDESVLRWYSYNGNTLSYDEEEKVFEATLAIGDNVYDYTSLLDALGLIREAITLQEKGKDADEKLEEAYQTLLEGKTTKNSDDKNSSISTQQQEEMLGDMVGPNPQGSYDASVNSSSSEQSQGDDLGESGGVYEYEEGYLDDAKTGDDYEELDQKDKDTSKETEDEKTQDATELDPEVSAETTEGAESGSSSGSSGSSSSSSGGGSSGGGSSGSSGGGSSSSGSGSSNGSGTSEGTGTSTETGGDGDEETTPEGGIIYPEDNENLEDLVPEDSTGSLSSDTEVAFTQATVKFGNLDVWSYAVGAKLHIFDPSSTIISGVSVVVYSALDRDGSATETFVDPYTEETYTAYDGDIFNGKTALVSKTYRNDAEFALGELPINSTVYIKYSYSYYDEVTVETEILDENGNGTGEFETTTTRNRDTFTSDLIEITTKGMEEVNIVNAQWQEDFAASNSGISMFDLSILNSDDTYDADLEDFDFENYKKDSATYLTSMKLNITSQNDVPIAEADQEQISVSYSTLNSAKSSPTSYKSTYPTLDSDSKYTYTAQAYDKKLNEFPVQISQDYGNSYVLQDFFEGTFYTQKQAPTATIEEVENVADKLTVKITISDPDNALIEGGDVYLTANKTTGSEAILYGYGDVSGGDALDDSIYFGASNELTELKLEGVKDGQTYYFRLESLDFSTFYILNVTGSYDPTPSVAPANMTLEQVNDSAFGSKLLYTTALSYGSIGFTVAVSAEDTYATITSTMNSTSNLDLVTFVDEFVFNILDNQDNSSLVSTYTLKETDMSDYWYDYEHTLENGIYTVYLETDDSIPFDISFTGYESQFVGKTLWEAFCITTDETAVSGYSSPITLNVSIKSGTLNTSHLYGLSMQSLVIKSTSTTQITTNLSRDYFYTKKVAPVIFIDDVFLSGEYLTILDLYVEDVDATVTGGQVLATLKYGDITLYSQFLQVYDGTEDTIYKIEIDGLIEGEEYQFTITAQSYKDTVDGTSYQQNVELYSRTCTAGGNLNGHLSLISVDYTTVADQMHEIVSISGEQAGIEMAASSYAVTGGQSGASAYYDEWRYYNTQYYATQFSPVYELDAYKNNSDDISYIYIPDYQPSYSTENLFYKDSGGTQRMANYIYVYFYYTNDYGEYVYKASSSRYILDGRGMVMMPIPQYTDGTVITGVSFGLPGAYVASETNQLGDEIDELYQVSYLESNGFTAYYVTPDEYIDLLANPDDVYDFSTNTLNEGVSGAYGGTYYNNYPSTDTGYLTEVSTQYGSLHMIPVNPGDVYVRWSNGTLPSSYTYTENAATVRFYNADGSIIGTQASGYSGAAVVIPENCEYMSIVQQIYYSSKPYWGTMIKVISGPESGSDSYGATVSTTVNYEGVEANVPDYIEVSLQYSDSMEMPVYSDVDSIKLYKDTNPDGSQGSFVKLGYTDEGLVQYGLELTDDDEAYLKDMYTDLSRNDNFRIEISTVYQGDSITLDYMTFDTDGVYKTIDHGSEMKILSRYSHLNYIVTEDFVYDQQSFYSTLDGTIDFQGHIITRKADDNTIQSLITINNGTIKNLVYDIYDTELSITFNYGITVNTNYGLIENIVVRTYEDLTIKSASSLVVDSTSTDGILNNFIVKLGGDLIFNNTTTSRTGVVAESGSGTFKNGYVYAANAGDGVVIYTSDDYTGSYASGLVGTVSGAGNWSNVYTDFDLWVDADESAINQGAALAAYAQGKMENVYAVGDHYKYIEGGVGKSVSFLDEPNLVSYGYANPILENIWLVSDHTYEPETIYNMSVHSLGQKGIAQLYDISWQEEMLGDGFDIEESINMGFFPRLNLPIEMQKYQEYRALPLMDTESAPILLSERFTDDYVKADNATSAQAIFTFQNLQGVNITEISIANLVTEVVSTQTNDEGLYEVFVDISIDPTNPSYLSEYTVSYVRYTYSNKTYTTYPTYDTTNISFWKTVSSVTDWTAINNQMYWNYLITKDISFTGITWANIVIQGTGSYNTSGTFQGNIDGGGYTLSNITMSNTDAPWVIYQLQYGSVKNLTIDNMTLISQSRPVASQTGFIRYAVSQDTYIDNVHITNSTIGGVGCTGALVGNVAYSPYITNCSATDTTIYDVSSTYTGYFGGIVGYINHNNIYNCFTRNVDISVTNTATVSGVGGIIGYGANSATMYNCYAHGTIKAEASYVGGLAGTSTYLVDSWSYVSLDVYGDYVGGALGYSNYSNENTFAVGNVVATGSNVNRLSGAYNSDSNQYYRYNDSAYYGQNVTGLMSGEAGDAQWLVAGSDIAKYATWTDTIKSGTSWDYSSLEDGYFPLLYSTYPDENGDSVILPNQLVEVYLDDGTTEMQGIQLPGQGYETSMEVTSATYYDYTTSEKFEVVLTINHAGIDIYDLANILTSDEGEYVVNTSSGDITISQGNVDTNVINVEGMDMIDKYGLDYKKADILIEPTSDSAVSTVIINMYALEYYLDSYRLTLKYDYTTTDGDSTINSSADLLLAFEYSDERGNHYIPYFAIANIGEWNAFMEKDDYSHQTTGENLLITGNIDFTGATVYKNLKLGRLTGSGDSAKISNLTINGGTNGDAWIDNVAYGIDNVDFSNIVGSFNAVTGSRSRTGIILAAGGLSNCTLSDISLYACNNSDSYLGFISYLSGDMVDVTVEKGDIYSVFIDMSMCTSSSEYTGGVAAVIVGKMENVDVSDVIITSNYIGTYVGGVVGSQSEHSSGTNSNITVDNVNIKAYNGVAAVSGHYLRSSTDITVTNCTIDAKIQVAGVARYATVATSNITVDNLKITGMYNTNNTSSSYVKAGVYCVASGVQSNLTVKNSTIEGDVILAGVIGRQYYCTLSNVLLIDTDITSLDTGSYTSTYSASGGIFGIAGDSASYYLHQNIVIRNVNIYGYKNAGGLIGYTIYNGAQFNGVYIAEDVTITAGKSAGGAAGDVSRISITNGAIGATVTATGAYDGEAYAGAIAGTVEYRNSLYHVYVYDTYFVGEVVSADRASGLVARYYDSTGTATVTETVDSYILSADISSSTLNSKVGAFRDVELETSANEFYAFEDMTLDGIELQTLISSSDDAYATYLPVGSANHIIDEDWFKSEDSYVGIGFDATRWSFQHLTDVDNEFMPYVTYTDTAATDDADAVVDYILEYANKIDTPATIDNPDYDAEQEVSEDNPLTIANPDYNEDDPYTYVGILLPEPGTVSPAIVAYASGINTINIEIKLDDEETSRIIFVNGTEFTVDEVLESGYGVLTLSYDYKTALTVNYDTDDNNVAKTKSYTASELARDVMTYGNYWYLEDDTVTESEYKLIYGSTTAKSGELVFNEDIVHMWNGLVLTTSGYVYDVSSATAIEQSGYEVSGIESVTTVPFATTTVGALVTSNYYNFTAINGIVMKDIRVYNITDTLSQTVFISNAQDVAHDGVQLVYAGEAIYYGYLEGNTLVSANGKMNLKYIYTDGIDYTSNSLGYTLPVVVIRYADTDRTVTAVNYWTGTVLYTTAEDPTFIEYAISAVTNSISSLFSTYVQTDYEQNQELLVALSFDDYSTYDDGGLETDGTSVADGESLGGTVSTDEEQEFVDGEYVDGQDDGQEGTSNASGEDSNGEETSSSNSEVVEGEGEIVEGVGEIVFASGVTATLISTDSDTDSTESDDSDEGGSGSGSSSTTTITGVDYPDTATYDVEEQTLTTSLGVIKIENSTYVEGSGLYVENELIYLETGTSSETGEARMVELISVEAQYEAVLESLGELIVAYDTQTGTYGVFDTKSILDNNPQNVSSSIIEDEVEQANVDGNSNFAVNQSMGRTLTQTEKSGFTLLSFVCISSIFVLLAIYIKVRKRD